VIGLPLYEIPLLIKHRHNSAFFNLFLYCCDERSKGFTTCSGELKVP